MEDLLHRVRAVADRCRDAAEAHRGHPDHVRFVAECDRCEATLRATVHDLGQGNEDGLAPATTALGVCADECEQFDDPVATGLGEACRDLARELSGDLDARFAKAQEDAIAIEARDEAGEGGELTEDARP